jgi:hypothetical protein
MSITVTPIPTLIEFATPSITIGATAAAGDALTAIRSNSTIAGVALVATTVDDAIARFNGTAGQLQGYTSDSPTISDAGVISLTSGQLTFPATQAASADANTLDDYEEGTFTPTIQDNSDSPDEGQTYYIQVGRYIKIGKMVHFQINLSINSIGTLTTSQIARIAPLPFAAVNAANTYATAYSAYGGSLALDTAGANITGLIYTNTSYIGLRQWTGTGGTTSCLVSNVSAGAHMVFGGSYEANA